MGQEERERMLTAESRFNTMHLSHEKAKENHSAWLESRFH